MALILAKQKLPTRTDWWVVSQEGDLQACNTTERVESISQHTLLPNQSYQEIAGDPGEILFSAGTLSRQSLNFSHTSYGMPLANCSPQQWVQCLWAGSVSRTVSLGLCSLPDAFGCPWDTCCTQTGQFCSTGFLLDKTTSLHFLLTNSPKVNMAFVCTPLEDDITLYKGNHNPLKYQ